jgi:hypothetical protein
VQDALASASSTSPDPPASSAMHTNCHARTSHLHRHLLRRRRGKGLWWVKGLKGAIGWDDRTRGPREERKGRLNRDDDAVLRRVLIAGLGFELTEKVMVEEIALMLPEDILSRRMKNYEV